MVPGDRSDEPSFSAVNLVADEKEFREGIPELDQKELRKDTLEFEPVRRRAPRRRRGVRRLVIIIGVVIVAVGAWAIWGDYLTGGSSDTIPIVRAPIGPIKVRPDTPGGINIPNRDKLVYDRLEKKPQNAKLRPYFRNRRNHFRHLARVISRHGAIEFQVLTAALNQPPERAGRYSSTCAAPQPSKSVEQAALPAPVVPVPAPRCRRRHQRSLKCSCPSTQTIAVSSRQKRCFVAPRPSPDLGEKFGHIGRCSDLRYEFSDTTGRRKR